MPLSPELAARLLAEHPEEAKIAWRPAPCFYCSGAIVDGQLEPHVNTIRGTGRDPFDPSKPCPECVKRNHPAAFGYGPQGVALLKKDFEILMSGVKRSGKTETATVWMVRGNPDEPEYDKQGQPIPVNWSYAFHSDFRGLVIRKDLKDLTDWRTFAEPYYASFSPPLRLVGDQFVCDATGARIYIGHLHDSSSYERIMGLKKLHRVWIDEASHIGDPSLYFQVMSCLSTTEWFLRCQILLTTNWVGPGVGWLRERFLESVDFNGKAAQPFHSTVELVEVGGRKSYRSRIFINTGIQDNPHVKDYYATLKLLPEKEQQIYLYGNPYAMEGTYFDIFRPNGPQGSEPDNADHVIPRWEEKSDPQKKLRSERAWNPYFKLNKKTGYPDLLPWWPRAIGGDWGYAHESAFVWACQHPDSKQIIVYREFAVSSLTARLLGVEVARRTLPDLERLPDNAITLYFSHDAFSQKGIGGEEGIMSTVELLAQGIAQVLGPDAVWLPELEIKALELAAHDDVMPGFEQKFQDYKRSILEQRRKGITIRMANRQRIHGLQLMREMMVWKKYEADMPEPDQTLYQTLCREQGMEAAAEYLSRFRRRETILPQLQILETECPRLIQALPKLVHQDPMKRGGNPEDVELTHFSGRDLADASRYLLAAFRDQEVTAPLADRRAEFAAVWREQNPSLGVGAMIEAQRFFEAQQQSGNVPIRSAAGRLREQRGRIRKGWVQ